MTLRELIEQATEQVQEQDPAETSVLDYELRFFLQESTMPTGSELDVVNASAKRIYVRRKP